MKRKRKNINAVARPTHPGRTIYTAILGAKMSVGEVATTLGISREQFVQVLRGKKRLSARYAFLLAELFTWDRALRWYIMQSKCDMYLSAVKERRARRALLHDDASDYTVDEWKEEVAQAWDISSKDDYKEMEDYSPLPGDEDEDVEVTMKEELDGK